MGERVRPPRGAWSRSRAVEEDGRSLWSVEIKILSSSAPNQESLSLSLPENTWAVVDIHVKSEISEKIWLMNGFSGGKLMEKKNQSHLWWFVPVILAETG